MFYHEHYGNAVAAKPNALKQYLYLQTVFIAVSNKLAMWAKEVIGLPAQKVFVLPNTVIKVNAAPPHQRADGVRLCMTGNILPNKNMAFALQLLHDLQQTYKEATLIIIGAIADEKYYRQLLSFINEHHLERSVSFVTDCRDVQQILHQFHIALHTSFSESGPLVLIEYMAQGLPFVTYNTGEVVSQVQQYLPHFVMDDFDTDKWIHAIIKIIATAGKEQRARLQGLYNQHFSPEDYYQKCIAIYKAGLVAIRV